MTNPEDEVILKPRPNLEVPESRPTPWLKIVSHNWLEISVDEPTPNEARHEAVLVMSRPERRMPGRLVSIWHKSGCLLWKGRPSSKMRKLLENRRQSYFHAIVEKGWIRLTERVPRKPEESDIPDYVDHISSEVPNMTFQQMADRHQGRCWVSGKDNPLGEFSKGQLYRGACPICVILTNEPERADQQMPDDVTVGLDGRMVVPAGD